MNIYLSRSRLNNLNRCAFQVFCERHPKDYPALSRKATSVLGIAIHDCIKTLHSEKDPETDMVFDFSFEMEENKIGAPPIDYGKRGRDWYVARGRKLAYWYWHFNKDIKVVSTERWFFLTIGADMHIRGRFDMLLVEDTELVLWDFISGIRPNETALEFDSKMPLEALACKQGMIAMADLAYTSEADEGYHIHEWEPDLTMGRYKCKHCKIEAQMLDRFPRRISLYHLPSLIPTERDIKIGNLVPRRKPEIEMEYSESDMINLVSGLKKQFIAYRNCEASGVWPRTMHDGFGSPCGTCDYRLHCADKKLCTVVQEVESDE